MTSVADHYQRDVATIPVDATARAAADAMRAQAVGSLVVLQDGAPVGMLTDRDLLGRVVAEGRDPAVTSARDIMSQPLRVAAPEEPLDRVVERMSEQGIRRIPVVHEGRLVGLVALDDVLVEVAEELHDVALGMQRELVAAQRGARARELAQEMGERVRDLGGQLEHLGGETKQRLLREIESLRERIRRPKE